MMTCIMARANAPSVPGLMPIQRSAAWAVRVLAGPDEPLGEDAEARGVARSVRWFRAHALYSMDEKKGAIEGYEAAMDHRRGRRSAGNPGDGHHRLADRAVLLQARFDLADVATTATRDGDDWVLNGSKTYISNGINGGAFVVAARTVPDQRHGIGLFVVEEGMEGFQRGRNLAKMGLKTQDTAELFFEDVRVPAGNVLGDPEKGFYSLMHFLAEERLISACQAIAHAQVAFDLTLDYILERKAFGRPIGAFQNSRFRMAEMRTELDVTQTFVDQCVLLHNDGELSAELAAEAKLKTTELESRVMDDCVQLHGGAGYMSEYRISHMFADARVSRIYAGSSEIMKEIIARGIGLDERKLCG